MRSHFQLITRSLALLFLGACSFGDLQKPQLSNSAVAGQPGNLFVFGGLGAGKTHADITLKSYLVSIRHPDKAEWLPPLPDTLGKIASAASTLNNIIYIVGGYHVFPNHQERSSNKVHRFSIATHQFLPDATSLPYPIDDHVQAVWRDSLLFVVTGWSDSTNVPFTQIYDPNTDQWKLGSPVPDDSIFTSFGASGAFVRDTLYYFGGASRTRTFPIQPYLRKGVISPQDPTSLSWTHIQLPDSLAGYRQAVAVNFPFIYWMGGSRQTYNYDGITYAKKQFAPAYNRVLRYNTQTKGIAIARLNFPLDLRGQYQSETLIHVFGGMDASLKVLNHIHSVNLDTLTFIKLAL